MRFFSRRKKQPSDTQGFIPLVASTASDKNGDGDFYAGTIDPPREENEKLGFYEPPCFNSNFQDEVEKPKTSSVKSIDVKQEAEPSCEQKRDDSMETVAETITTESTDKMSETPSSQMSETPFSQLLETPSLLPSLLQVKTGNVRPVLITVEPKECFDDSIEAYSTDMLNSEVYHSPPRKIPSSTDLQGNSSEEHANLSDFFPASPMSAVSAISATTFDDSAVEYSRTNFSMGESKSMNGSSVTGLSMGSSWDNDSMTRGSELDTTTIGSDSQYTNDKYSHANNSRWDVPSNIPKAVKKAAHALQDIMEDLSQCGAYVVKTAEEAVCGPEEIDDATDRKSRNLSSRDRKPNRIDRKSRKRS